MCVYIEVYVWHTKVYWTIRVECVSNNKTFPWIISDSVLIWIKLMLHHCARPELSAPRSIPCLSPSCPALYLWEVCPLWPVLPRFPHQLSSSRTWLMGGRHCCEIVGELKREKPGYFSLPSLPWAAFPPPQKKELRLSHVSRTLLSCQDSHCLLWPWPWTQVTLWPFSLGEVATHCSCQSQVGPPCWVLLFSFYHLHKELNALYFTYPEWLVSLVEPWQI